MSVLRILAFAVIVASGVVLGDGAGLDPHGGRTSVTDQGSAIDPNGSQ